MLKGTGGNNIYSAQPWSALESPSAKALACSAATTGKQPYRLRGAVLLQQTSCDDNFTAHPSKPENLVKASKFPL
jgi:hypothetical protein